MSSQSHPPGINCWKARRRAAEKEVSTWEAREAERMVVETQVHSLLESTQGVIQVHKDSWKLLTPETREMVKNHNASVTGIRPAHIPYQEKMRRAPAIKANVDLCMELGLRVNLSREDRSCLDYETRQRIFYYNKKTH